MPQLELQFRLACTPGHAFRIFTEMVDRWWPDGHKRRPEAAMVFEPGAGGRLIERTTAGDSLVGEVVEWAPPHRLALDWWLGAATYPTRVEIGFASSDLGTTITVLHTPGAAEEDGIWDQRVARFESGWTAVFAALAEHVAGAEA